MLPFARGHVGYLFLTQSPQPMKFLGNSLRPARRMRTPCSGTALDAPWHTGCRRRLATPRVDQLVQASFDEAQEGHLFSERPRR